MIRTFIKACAISLFCSALAVPLAAQEKKAQETTEEQQDELVVTADRMEMQLDGKTVELTGNVRIEDSAMSLTSLKMMVYLTEADDKVKDGKKGEGQPQEKEKEKAAKDDDGEHSNMKLQRIEADGEVVLRKLDGTESAMGDHAVYDVKDDTIVMTGNCSIIQGKNNMQGNKVIYNRKIGKINIDKPRLTIQIDKKGGKGGGIGSMFNPKDGKDDKKKDAPTDAQAPQKQDEKPETK